MSRYIDADALIMALRLEYPMMPMFKENQKEWEIKTDGYRKAEEVIRNAPSIDIEPKRGKWKTEVLNPLNAILRCSICGRYSVVRYNFCPDCGADNRGEGND